MLGYDLNSRLPVYEAAPYLLAYPAAFIESEGIPRVHGRLSHRAASTSVSDASIGQNASAASKTLGRMPFNRSRSYMSDDCMHRDQTVGITARVSFDD